MTNFLFAYADDLHIDLNSSFWRCEIPAHALKAAGHTAAMVHVDYLHQIDVAKDFEVVIIERELIGPRLDLVQNLHSDGVRVYVTFDDNYEVMPAGYQGKKFWSEYIESFKQGLGMVDAALVPSKTLVDYFSKYGEMRLVENYFPRDWLKSQTPPLAGPLYTLGWSGNATHHDSWLKSGLADALRANKQWSLMVNTIDPRTLDLLNGLYKKRVAWIPQREYWQLPDMFKVGLAPLTMGGYDSYRSNLKLLMYGMRQRPWVATKAQPYLSAKGGVLVDNTSKGWAEGIAQVLNNWDRYAAEAEAFAETYTIEQHIEEYARL